MRVMAGHAATPVEKGTIAEVPGAKLFSLNCIIVTEQDITSDENGAVS